MWTRTLARSSRSSAAADAIVRRGSRRRRGDAIVPGGIASSAPRETTAASGTFVAFGSGVVDPPGRDGDGRGGIFARRDRRRERRRGGPRVGLGRQRRGQHSQGRFDYGPDDVDAGEIRPGSRRWPIIRRNQSTDGRAATSEIGYTNSTSTTSDGYDFYDDDESWCSSQYDEWTPPPLPPRHPEELQAADGRSGGEDEESEGEEDDDEEEEDEFEPKWKPRSASDIVQPKEEDDDDNWNRSFETKRERDPPPPIGSISSWEATRVLNRACIERRGIPLNKRQRLKPWIPALLMHRYDRGIRDGEELNLDNAYYRDAGEDSWGVGGGGYEYNPHEIQFNNPVRMHIDLRKVLKPKEHEAHAFIHALHNSPGTNEAGARLFNFTSKGRQRAKKFLIHEKMALLAREARRVLIDREIPFLELTGLESEEEARGLAQEDPATYLGRFARAVALTEVEATERGEDGLMDFLHRRHGPPSLDDSATKEEGAAVGREPDDAAGKKHRKNGEGGHAGGTCPDRLPKEATGGREEM